ncbi:AmpG family muropeptide MFS transporter [Bacterioplanes sanyensis]|uniref:AmpG family muropeptide MFS transporter n=1 Tax=Bacterioplanes sanyensis TaxID=1249553 RepID=A0A222FLP1_9GAMM|nr:MFS transporter [Bacterioplanes sanyensis]ASP39434.1 AmpG family muropeptide MFS transporter [Bacterioplanes sanyensis]
MLSLLRQLRDTYGHKPVAVLGALGFAAGLPFLLVFTTLTAWLTEAGLERSTIGFFAWVGMTYSVKVFWAPAIDRLKIPWLTHRLGKRRSWILIGQLGVASGLLLMSQIDPAHSISAIALLAVLVAFSSATQDIAIDAYRIEIADDEWQGALSAAYYFGYRVALLVAGAGALYLAEWGGWSQAYVVMACIAALIMLVTVWAERAPEVTAEQRQQQEYQLVDETFGRPMQLHQRPAWQRWWLGAVVCPFLEFFRRNGWLALVILTFIGVFRLSDLAMGAMANPFYLDLGYSKTDIASVAKLFGFFMTIAGSALCGVAVVRLGIYRPLLAGAVLVASTNLLFAWLAWLGLSATPSLLWLALVISADNLSGGIAGTAFIAYLSSLTNRHYTATQYALFSSLMTLPGKFISGFSGVVVDQYGYIEFFVVAAMLGLPAILLVLYLWRRIRPAEASEQAS